jgi:photosystem II stability/assembly factor-like uncharacterized protein
MPRRPRRILLAVAAVTAVAAVGYVAPVTAGADARHATLHFTVRLDVPGQDALASVSCPTVAVCTVVGGDATGVAVLFRTTDGGVTWSVQHLPTLVGALRGVSCPTVSFCLAWNDTSYPLTLDRPSFYATTDGGATWATMGSFNFVGASTMLDCASTTSCYFVGAPAQLFHSTDGGATWTSVTWQPSVPIDDLLGISCGMPSTCDAVGIRYLSTRAGSRAVFLRLVGSTAAAAPLPTWPSGLRPSGLSCVGATRCVAIGLGPSGTAMLRTVDGGATWTRHPLPTTFAATGALRCASVTACSALVTSAAHPAGVLLASTADLQRWSVTRVAWGNGDALDCPGVGACVVPVNATRLGGVLVAHGHRASWSSTNLQTGAFGPAFGIACPTSGTCFALDDPALRSTDGGGSWAPAAFAPLTEGSVACPTTTECVAVTNSARIGATLPAYRSTDRGATWTTVLLPRGNQSVADLTCASPTTCLAVSADPATGSGGYAYGHYFRTSDGGATWSRLRSLEPLASVACGSATRCVALGTSGGAYRSVNAGATWTPEQDLYTSIGRVACASASTCFAIGTVAPHQVRYETTDGGRHWQLLATSLVGWEALGCNRLACWYVDDATDSLRTSTDRGATWASSPLPTTMQVDAATALAGGRWVLVGENPAVGAMAATSP